MARNDHFSAFASTYATFRPTYPPELFEHLAAQSPSTDHAWDCATGNGQAAVSLATHFDHVTATDVGANMIKHSIPHSRVTYQQGSAEDPPLADDSIDLITVAQALHWFDRPTFWTTCRRVLKTNGILAYWGYLLPKISPAIDPIVDHYHENTVGDYWPPDREPLLNLYADLSPPADRISTQDFTMTAHWNVDLLIGMLDSWSATHRARAQTRQDPLAPTATRLRAVWPNDNLPLRVEWPLKLHAYRFNSSA